VTASSEGRDAVADALLARAATPPCTGSQQPVFRGRAPASGSSMASAAITPPESRSEVEEPDW
jgi:hypothetical protein